MEININDQTFFIDEKIWNKHIVMHPVRPIDALKSNIRIVLDDNNITSANIEKLILNEYEMLSNINTIVEKARGIF